MPEALKETTDTPSLTADNGVVVPDVTTIKPAKAMKQYRPEKKSLAKLNMEEANVGEVDSTGMEEKSAGVIQMDPIAYLSGYCTKEAQGITKATGAKLGGVQLGSSAARKKARKLLDQLRVRRGMKPAAPHVQHRHSGGGSAGSRKQRLEAALEG